MIYKLLHGFVICDTNQLFTMSVNHTRGHKFKLVKPKCNLNCVKFSFSCSNIDAWNYLQSIVVDANTVKNFSTKLDKSRSC
jgi:hypothetical protein